MSSTQKQDGQESERVKRRGGMLLAETSGFGSNQQEQIQNNSNPGFSGERKMSLSPDSRFKINAKQDGSLQSIPNMNLRRPTLEDTSPKPGYRKLIGNERRSSFGGVSHNVSHEIARNAHLLEVEAKSSRSRRYSVIRIKSETKMKPDTEKHLPAAETLTEQQINAFKEAFDLFDNNGGGTIDALELKETLESVGIELDEAEIHDVMMRLDKDGNGEIDFEEFLDLMTNTEMFLEAFASRHEPGSEMDRVRERDVLLFDALTEFMKKSALKDAHEIVGYYAKKYKKVVKSYNANKGAHVVGHYADGARLIGLTEKQIVQQLKKLMLCQNFENKGEKDSPYAQPLQLSVLRSVTSSPKKKFRKPRKKKIPKPATAPTTSKRNSKVVALQEFRPQIDGILQPSPRRQSSSSETNLMTPKQIIQPFKKKRIVLKIINNDLLHNEHKKPEQHSKRDLDKKRNHSVLRVREEILEHKPGWLSQRNKMYNVEINMPVRYSRVQVDRLPELRDKVEKAKSKFVDVIARKKIQNNIRHYKELDSRRIPSPVLYEHFKRVFCSYSSAETNNRTSVTTTQLKKAGQQNHFHRREGGSKFFYHPH